MRLTLVRESVLHASHPAVQNPRALTLFSALAVAVLAISSAALWIRMSHAGPLAIAFFRLLYACALLGPFALRPTLREASALTRRERWMLVGSGVALSVHFAAWIASRAPSSPVATSVAASATLVASHPVLVAAATPWLSGKPVPYRAKWGIALALVGAAVIAAGDIGHGTHRWAGDLLALVGAGAGAAYFLLGGRLRATLGLRAYVLPVYAVAAVALGLMALAAGDALRGLGAREHALFLALAVGPMILGHTLLNWSLRYLPAWAVSTTILAEPVASSTLVFFALGEVPPGYALAGAGPVLGGLVMIARGGTR